MEKDETLGQRLRALRKARRLTQMEAAAEVEISRSHLTKIERDHDTAGAALLRRLADFYRVSVDYLQTGAHPRSTEVPDKPHDGGIDTPWDILGRELDEGEKTALFEFAHRVLVRRRAGSGARRSSRQRRHQ